MLSGMSDTMSSTTDRHSVTGVDRYLVYMPSGGRWPRICGCTCS